MLTGKNIVAGRASGEGRAAIVGVDPATGTRLDPRFHEATDAEIETAVSAALVAFQADGHRSGRDRRALLDAIADAIEKVGDALVERVVAETGLAEGRVRGERGRTTGQLRKFAALVGEGSWKAVRIDTAQPARTPLPKPDIRTMSVPLGPVAVFGASNFPLAFSVAGGDTASALAAGCPVVCKAHPAHPGTSELVAGAITWALEHHGFHPGNFSLLHGAGGLVGQKLVKAPEIKAVGFTGSLGAGRALFDAAAARPEPIPVFAEMGSVNPVFVLAGAQQDRAEAIANGLASSVTLGSGQFCTNPGLVFVQKAENTPDFLRALKRAVAAATDLTMLTRGIQAGYDQGVSVVESTDGVSALAVGGKGRSATSARARVFVTDAATFRSSKVLYEEVFGPSTIVVQCQTPAEMAELASRLKGNLTGTVHASEEDQVAAGGILRTISGRVGRIVYNGFPTGVEVCPAIHHGGPYPATTDSRWTSVGTAAIDRFVRPLCLQNMPENFLPPEMHDKNPLGIMRMVNGEYTRDAIG